MTIEDLGNLGELLAAVGVIISLVYIARQLRANTAALHAESRDRNFGNLIAHTNPALIDKELMGVWLTGLDDPKKLDREDAERFERMLLQRFVYMQIVYMRGIELGDPHASTIVRNLLSQLLGSQAAVDRWRRYTARPEFKEFVDSIIADNRSGVT